MLSRSPLPCASAEPSPCAETEHVAMPLDAARAATQASAAAAKLRRGRTILRSISPILEPQRFDQYGASDRSSSREFAEISYIHIELSSQVLEHPLARFALRLKQTTYLRFGPGALPRDSGKGRATRGTQMACSNYERFLCHFAPNFTLRWPGAPHPQPPEADPMEFH